MHKGNIFFRQWRKSLEGGGYQLSVIADQQACQSGESLTHLVPSTEYPSLQGGGCESVRGALSAPADSRNFLLPWVQKWQRSAPCIELRPTCGAALHTTRVQKIPWARGPAQIILINCGTEQPQLPQRHQDSNIHIPTHQHKRPKCISIHKEHAKTLIFNTTSNSLYTLY